MRGRTELRAGKIPKVAGNLIHIFSYRFLLPIMYTTHTIFTLYVHTSFAIYTLGQDMVNK